jgi:hypothetical protein
MFSLKVRHLSELERLDLIIIEHPRSRKDILRMYENSREHLEGKEVKMSQLAWYIECRFVCPEQFAAACRPVFNTLLCLSTTSRVSLSRTPWLPNPSKPKTSRALPKTARRGDRNIRLRVIPVRGPRDLPGPIGDSPMYKRSSTVLEDPSLAVVYVATRPQTRFSISDVFEEELHVGKRLLIRHSLPVWSLPCSSNALVPCKRSSSKYTRKIRAVFVYQCSGRCQSVRRRIPAPKRLQEACHFARFQSLCICFYRVSKFCPQEPN